MSPLCVAPFCPVLSFVAPCCLHLTLCVSRVRGAGTAAINLSLVASGCVEAYYEMGMHVWDIAAGSLLVLEAGGVVMDVDGGDVDLMSRRIVAANNRSVALRLVEQIAPYRPDRDDVPPTAYLKHGAVTHVVQQGAAHAAEQEEVAAAAPRGSSNEALRNT
ncbi:hypothetical protein CCH79_00021024 [Gambusia affinis]|uniref:Inositol monophosphatase 1 n=1 Tax=Gambusia affinis TaxID=33528 RepID=A0A315VPR6_GAMAF|nr:hypothetical protein CCH79_00021024 [Gambusia affinis]